MGLKFAEAHLGKIGTGKHFVTAQIGTECPRGMWSLPPCKRSPNKEVTAPSICQEQGEAYVIPQDSVLISGSMDISFTIFNLKKETL